MEAKKSKWLLYVEISLLIVIFFIIGKFVWWMLGVAFITLLGFAAYMIWKGWRDYGKVKNLHNEQIVKKENNNTSEQSDKNKADDFYSNSVDE